MGTSPFEMSHFRIGECVFSDFSLLQPVSVFLTYVTLGKIILFLNKLNLHTRSDSASARACAVAFMWNVFGQVKWIGKAGRFA